MAESQILFSYPQKTVQELTRALSQKRYDPYLKGAGYKPELAFQLYLYNARLAKSFLFPLHVVEVVLRNAIDEVLTKDFNANWHVDRAFTSLLTPESSASLSKAVARASSNSGGASKDNVVANLNFDFWSNLFRSEYDRSLWQTNMATLLPNAIYPTRHNFQAIVASINRFRNRIAHHEPIWGEDISKRIGEITEVVGWRSTTTKKWLQAHTTVPQMMRTKPTPGVGAGGTTLGQRCDTNFETFEIDSKLSECHINDACAIVCLGARGIEGVLDASDVGRYVARSADDSGLIDMNEHCIKDVIAFASANGSFVILDGAMELAELRDQIKGKGIRFAVIVDPATTQVIGVIKRAHRHY